MRSALRISSANSDWIEISHVEVWFRFKGILNLEWAVFPPGNNNAAIPEEATERTILFCDRMYEISVLYKNVLPVPPGPSTKKRFFPSKKLIQFYNLIN